MSSMQAVVIPRAKKPQLTPGKLSLWCLEKREIFGRCSGWWWLEHFLFSHILRMSSSQLTNIFQRGSNHQPDVIIYLSVCIFVPGILICLGALGISTEKTSPKSSLFVKKNTCYPSSFWLTGIKSSSRTMASRRPQRFCFVWKGPVLSRINIWGCQRLPKVEVSGQGPRIWGSQGHSWSFFYT